ncbi:MAG: glycosyltransferase [Anaerolineales bacterium]|nr:glycosyltransferase [Anaerolineales bacterium]
MPEMLRLAIVTSYFYPHIGGIATQLSALAPRLHAAGAEVHVLAPEAQAEPYAGSGVTVHPLRIRGQRLASSSAFVTQSVALLARLRPHVIHARTLIADDSFGAGEAAGRCKTGGLGSLCRTGSGRNRAPAAGALGTKATCVLADSR